MNQRLVMGKVKSSKNMAADDDDDDDDDDEDIEIMI